MVGCLIVGDVAINTPKAQGRSTKMIEWIRTSRISIKKSLLPLTTSRGRLSEALLLLFRFLIVVGVAVDNKQQGPRNWDAIARVNFSDFRVNTRQKWRFQDVEYLRGTPRFGS